MEQVILEMRDITKIFPGVKALDKVSLQVHQGKVHAVCGENGAGKSTLIKVLSGVYPQGTYEGQIFINDEEYTFLNTSEAEKQGIVCIHQELELIPELSVGENIFLGKYPLKKGMINWDEIFFNTQELLKKVGLHKNKDKTDSRIKPNEKIKKLGIGQKQLVEIAKALARDAKILILDEPTAALTESEVDTLLDILNALREQGITCIYISHKLDEVMRIADNVTILRDGKTIGSAAISDITKNDIIRMMVGRELNNLFPYVEHQLGEIVLEVKNFSVQDPNIPGRKLIDNVSIKARKGEILGVSGLMGAGRTEFFSSVFGAFPAKREGEVFINGKKVFIKDPSDALKNGLALVSEDRKLYGLVLGMDVKENTTLASLEQVSRFGILNENLEIHSTNLLIKRLRTKTSGVEQKVKNLSGGNQQKVVLQKALLTKPKILVLDEPTRGIDVGAKLEIYKIMNQLVEEGVAIVMISSELEEVLGMSNRIVVMSQGKITAEMTSKEATQEKIMHAAIGGKQ
ncbi:MAG: xylose ABC transporter ATP-binding protein [Spirochaetia bacterium]|nr:xylose ABC transporter ATP-binding protein [Spirochaetia bacterium]